MKVWLDAHLSPLVAKWMRQVLGVEAVAVRDLGLSSATDEEIFKAARMAGAVVLSKDGDFVALLERHGPPPHVVWLTCGNTSNARLQALLGQRWPLVIQLLAAGEPLVEIGGTQRA